MSTIIPKSGFLHSNLQTKSQKFIQIEAT